MTNHCMLTKTRLPRVDILDIEASLTCLLQGK